MHIFIKNKKLTIGHYKVKCAVGKRGIGTKKREGDQITPRGKFKIKYILYRKDRIHNLKTKLMKLIIRKNYWNLVDHVWKKIIEVVLL